MASKLDAHLPEIIAWRKEGWTFVAIAAELARHKVVISGRGLSAWYWRRQSQRRERAVETAPFEETSASHHAPPPPPPEPAREPRPAADLDDWMTPAQPRKLVLKVMENSKPS